MTIIAKSNWLQFKKYKITLSKSILILIIVKIIFNLYHNYGNSSVHYRDVRGLAIFHYENFHSTNWNWELCKIKHQTWGKYLNADKFIVDRMLFKNNSTEKRFTKGTMGRKHVFYSSNNYNKGYCVRWISCTL